MYTHRSFLDVELSTPAVAPILRIRARTFMGIPEAPSIRSIASPAEPSGSYEEQKVSSTIRFNFSPTR